MSNISKFVLWSPNVLNVQDYDTFIDDEQRLDGFQAGTASSSIRVNSALRQANLVAAALMNCILPSGSTLDLTSSLSDITDAIESKFNTFLTGVTIDSTPTSGSSNAVSSGGVYTALAGKQATLTFDSTPTYGSSNPVTSTGVYSATSKILLNCTYSKSGTVHTLTSSERFASSETIFTLRFQLTDLISAGDTITLTDLTTTYTNIAMLFESGESYYLVTTVTPIMQCTINVGGSEKQAFFKSSGTSSDIPEYDGTVNINGTQYDYLPEGSTLSISTTNGTISVDVVGETTQYAIGGSTGNFSLSIPGAAIFTADAEWVCPKGVTSIGVLMFGAGGGRSSSTSGGGGSGHMAAGTIDVTPGVTYPISIGQISDAGGGGGSTSFSDLLTALGGSAATNYSGAYGGSGGGGCGGRYRESTAGSGGAASYGGGGGGGGRYKSSTSTGTAGSGGSAGIYGGAGGNGGSTAGAAGTASTTTNLSYPHISTSSIGSGGSRGVDDSGGYGGAGGGGGGGYGGAGGYGGSTSSNSTMIQYGGGGGGGGGYLTPGGNGSGSVGTSYGGKAAGYGIYANGAYISSSTAYAATNGVLMIFYNEQTITAI